MPVVRIPVPSIPGGAKTSPQKQSTLTLADLFQFTASDPKRFFMSWLVALLGLLLLAGFSSKAATGITLVVFTTNSLTLAREWE